MAGLTDKRLNQLIEYALHLTGANETLVRFVCFEADPREMLTALLELRDLRSQQLHEPHKD